MNVEIETKFRVDSLAEIATRLDSLGAKLRGEVLEVDTYFDDVAGTLFESDCGLRLRRRISGESEKVILTYKGPRRKGRFKTRREIEIEVGDWKVTAELLGALHYDRALVFEKRRRLWSMDGCTVCLDELPLLGSFVEIEAPDEEMITRLLEKMKLADSAHINKSYAHLMRAKLCELGSDKNEVLFNE